MPSITAPAKQLITYREISEGQWGAYVGLQIIATGSSEAEVRRLISERFR